MYNGAVVSWEWKNAPSPWVHRTPLAHSVPRITERLEDFMDCDYCTDSAVGMDEDDCPSCGVCVPVVCPLPKVVETSGDDNESDEGNDE